MAMDHSRSVSFAENGWFKETISGPPRDFEDGKMVLPSTSEGEVFLGR